MSALKRLLLTARNRTRAWLGIEHVLSSVHEVRSAVTDADDYAHLALRPPPPFVAVLAVGLSEGEYGDEFELMPLTLGASCTLRRDIETIELESMVPLHAVFVIVFADLSRVDVLGIFHGTDLATAGIGPAPIARISKWEPHVKVRVQVRARP